MTNLDSILKRRDITLPKKVHLVKAMISNSHIWMWKLDCKESWVQKNRCFWTVVLEKTLKSLLDCTEIHLVHPKRNQSWIFIGRADDEAESPILCPPDVKNWLVGVSFFPDAGKDWRQEKQTTEDMMVGWHNRLSWWTWVWANSGSWWWTWKPGVLQFLGSQRVGHNWATELNWTEASFSALSFLQSCTLTN